MLEIFEDAGVHPKAANDLHAASARAVAARYARLEAARQADPPFIESPDWMLHKERVVEHGCPRSAIPPTKDRYADILDWQLSATTGPDGIVALSAERRRRF